MTARVILVPDPETDAVYAVPESVCKEQFMLNGEELEHAKNVLSEPESDVEGQGWLEDARSWRESTTYDYCEVYGCTSSYGGKSHPR